MATYTMPGTSAPVAYVLRRMQIDAQLERLRALLDEHQAQPAAGLNDWSVVGDLGAVSEWVGAAVSFLAGEDDDVLTPTGAEDLRERLQQKDARIRQLEQALAAQLDRGVGL